jgi:hypothetical protein
MLVQFYCIYLCKTFIILSLTFYKFFQKFFTFFNFFIKITQFYKSRDPVIFTSGER